MREIRMLRAMRRELETEPRRLLNGHAGGNPGHSQGGSYGPPRQFPTLPPPLLCEVLSVVKDVVDAASIVSPELRTHPRRDE